MTNKGKSPGNKRAGSIPPDKIAAARALYESHPKKRLADVAEETGVSLPTLKRYSTREKWRKAHQRPPTQAEQLAEEYRKKLTEVTPEQHDAARDALVAEQVQAERQRLLDRHRKEWDYPRSLAYQAVQSKNFETAKLAKITSETLRNVQEMERKAWGIDKNETENNITVVIERG